MSQSQSSSYTIASTLLRDEPDLRPFLVALFQFGAAPAPSGGEFWGGALINRVGRHDSWARQQPRRLARLGLLCRVQQGKKEACYAVIGPAGIRAALIEHGVDPFQKLPGDFFNHVGKIDRAAAA